MTIRIIGSLFLILMSIGCSVKKEATLRNEFKEVAVQKFGDSVVIEFNRSMTFALCYVRSKPTMKSPVNNLIFSIYDMKKEIWLYSEQKNSATVKWYDDLFIVVDAKPGVVSTDKSINDQMKHYYINVRTLEKTTKPN